MFLQAQNIRKFTPHRVSITAAGIPYTIAAPGLCQWTLWGREDPYSEEMVTEKQAMDISAGDQSPDVITALESAFDNKETVEFRIERDRVRPGDIDVHAGQGRVTSLEVGKDGVRLRITRRHE